MLIRPIQPEEKDKYNAVVSHPLQSWEWGQFREKTGVKVVRMGLFDEEKLVSGFLVTIHPIPKFSYTVGYCPKCNLPDDSMIATLKKIASMNNCLFIKLEPNVGTACTNNVCQVNAHQQIKDFLFSHGCVWGRPLFTKYSFQIDLAKTENELASGMKQKTRYNVNLGIRAGVKVAEDNY